MPPAPLKTLFVGSFRALEQCFLAETSAARRQDPLAPLMVLVPSQLLRLHLRRELARFGGGHANVRFLTLLELAREVAEPELQGQNLRRLSDAVRGLLVTKAIETAGDLPYFARVARRPGFRHAVWQTLVELRGAGVTLAQWRAVLARFRSREDAALLHKLSDLAAVWEQLEALFREHHYVDTVALLALASKLAPTFAPNVSIIIYGFDTLTSLEQRFLGELSSRRRAQVLLPAAAPTSAGVQPLRVFWRSLGFAEIAATEPAAEQPSALFTLQRQLFAEDSSRSDDVPTADDSVLFVSAPTRDREVDELAREILFPPQAQVQSSRRIGVLLRDNSRYPDLLCNGFARASLQGYFHQCQTLAEQTAGRALSKLATLLYGEYRRSDVMEFLLSAPVKGLSASPAQTTPLPAAQWNHFSLLAGITAGEQAWFEGLHRLRRQWEREQQEQESNDEGSTALVARMASLDEFAHFLHSWFDRLSDIALQRSWAEKLARLWSLFVELVEMDESSAAIAEEFSRASELDALGIEPTVERIVSFITDILRTPAARTGQFQVTEPTVCTYEEGLGLVFDEVLLCGLVEKEVPRAAAEDPLLLDAERLRLQEFLTDVSLPLRAAARDRERFLFQSAVTAAGRRLVVSYPRFEGAEGRERLPSVYLLRTLAALTGHAEDYAGLQTFMAAPPRGRYVPSTRLRSSPLPVITDMEAAVQRLSSVVNDRDSSVLATEISLRPALARALRAESRRFGQTEFSAFDGLLEREPLVAAWQASAGALRRPLSPTRMERYAECPFRYFALDVLALEDLAEASLLSGISPLTRGSLVHEILHTYYQQEILAKRLPWQDDAESRLTSVAEKIFDKVSRETLTGPPLLWRLEKLRIHEWLISLLERERNAIEPFVPIKLEEFFKIDFDVNSPLQFRGKIDRVDLAPDGVARVIDYKTGGVPPGMKDGSLNRGRALQLPVYRLAAQTLYYYRVQSAEYWYLSGGAKTDAITFSDEDWEQRQDDFRRIVTTISQGITGARFYPYPEDEKCERCPARSACGSGRWTSKWRHDLKSTRDFLAMAEEAK